MSNFSQGFLDRDRDLTRSVALVFGFEGLFVSNGTLNSIDWIAKMES